MENWIINKKKLGESNLLLDEYLILYLLYNKEYESLDRYFAFDFCDNQNLLEELQTNNYLRIEGNNWKSIILTHKSLELFKEEKSPDEIVSKIVSPIKDDIEDIISCLNKHSNSRYRSQSKSSQKFITARLTEYSKEDIIETTKFMCDKWKGTNQECYLRPETLYNETKFQNYYNEWYKSKNKKRKVNRM